MSMTVPDSDRLLERCRASVDGARDACARSADLLVLTSRIRDEARWTRLRVVERRGPHRTSAGFRIAGMVENVPMVARWVEGHGLLCPEPLRRRAEVVVAMGETFGDEEGPRVTASLTERTAAMLTVLRSLSRITSIEIEGGSLTEASGDG
jgi:hypothetical protein